MVTQAVTAIYNPAGTENTQVHVYHNTDNKNLGLQFRSEKSPKDQGENTLGPGSDAHEGYVVADSNLASTKFNGMELVFGVTEPRGVSVNSVPAPGKNGSQKGTHADGCKCPPNPSQRPVDISLVSPVYQVLASTEADNFKIASCSSDDNAWVFYLKQEDNSKELKIMEGVIGVANPDDYKDTTRILHGSSLGAYYTTEDAARYVIYQAQDGNLLREYNLDNGDTPIRNSSDAKPRCSFAVTVADTTVYIYYVNSNNDLRKITKPIGGKWGSSSDVPMAKSQVDPDSQVTVSSANGFNHIFYKAKGQSAKTGFYHVLDRL